MHAVKPCRLQAMVGGGDAHTAPGHGAGRQRRCEAIVRGGRHQRIGRAPGLQQRLKVKKGLLPGTAFDRAIVNGRDEGFTKLLFDEATHCIVGGGIVSTHAGDMIGEIALAIEMGADAVDIGKIVHPHPTLGESIGMAAEVAHGSCTDLPPQKKR